MTSMQQSRSSAERIGWVSEKFSNLDSNEFGQAVDDLYTSSRAITNAVVDEVEQGRISSIQGAAVIANLTGCLFGWPEFHRELTPSHLVSMLVGNGQSDGQDGQ